MTFETGTTAIILAISLIFFILVQKKITSFEIARWPFFSITGGSIFLSVISLSFMQIALEVLVIALLLYLGSLTSIVIFLIYKKQCVVTFILLGLDIGIPMSIGMIGILPFQMAFTMLLSGLVLIMFLFSYPGFGKKTVEAKLTRKSVISTITFVGYIHAIFACLGCIYYFVVLTHDPLYGYLFYGCMGVLLVLKLFSWQRKRRSGK
nr:hypothetical protein [Candidatus Sigynarchaeota archaeon]